MPGNEIAETFVLTAQQHAANSDGIERGQLVHDAHQVAADSFRRCNWPAGILDDAKTFLLFSRCLAIPQDFKDGEVSKIKHKISKHDEGQ